MRGFCKKKRRVEVAGKNKTKTKSNRTTRSVNTILKIQRRRRKALKRVVSEVTMHDAEDNAVWIRMVQHANDASRLSGRRRLRRASEFLDDSDSDPRGRGIVEGFTSSSSSSSHRHWVNETER